MVSRTHLNITFMLSLLVMLNDYAQLLQSNSKIIAFLSVHISEVVDFFFLPPDPALAVWAPCAKYVLRHPPVVRLIEVFSRYF